ncbi:MAG: tryptophan--tRNA ligase [Christensenellales bacterium]
MDRDGKKIIFSGIQPSGGLTLGNYIGALKNWAMLQSEYSCYYCVVDMHAITVRQNPAELRKRCVDLLALFIASGIDPEKNIVFFQSHVSAHAELAWVLNCYTYFGELGRMTQFKEKSARQEDNINAGLFTYPALMAADILLYQSDLVPVGSDQKQHLELSRDLAIRFNNAYSDTFTVPEAYIPKVGARIMSLSEPDKKMSKSDDNENGYILMLDPPDVIRRKLKRAVTDSGNEVVYSDDKPGVKNLMGIYAACTGKTIDETQREFEGKGYGVFKEAVAEAVIEELSPLQQRFNEVSKDKEYLNVVMKSGAEKAGASARRTLSKVYRKVGLAPTKL